MLVEVEVNGRLEIHHVRSLLVKKKGKWVEPTELDAANLIRAKGPRKYAVPVARPKRTMSRKARDDAKEARFRNGIRDDSRYLQWLGAAPTVAPRGRIVVQGGQFESNRRRH